MYSMFSLFSGKCPWPWKGESEVIKSYLIFLNVYLESLMQLYFAILGHFFVEFHQFLLRVDGLQVLYLETQWGWVGYCPGAPFRY